MKTFLKIITIISFSFLVDSCKKDDGPNLGCTDPTALNYNPNANEDDNSCIILGCTDSTSINYNPNATDDNGTCIYSKSSLLNGDWNIINIEYETEVLTQTISGEANDAGSWSFQYPEYIYSNTLSFVTEGINILGQTLPGFPIDINSEGTWGLSNDENTLTITDNQTGAVSSYQILSFQENNCQITGQIQTEILTMQYTVDVEMQLIKQ
jgi:hypothetical protein